jgi:hypothetical protein
MRGRSEKVSFVPMFMRLRERRQFSTGGSESLFASEVGEKFYSWQWQFWRRIRALLIAAG